MVPPMVLSNGLSIAATYCFGNSLCTVTAHLPQWCWVVMCMPLCILMSFVNNLSAMASVSAVGIVALIAGLISVWTYGVCGVCMYRYDVADEELGMFI